MRSLVSRVGSCRGTSFSSGCGVNALDIEIERSTCSCANFGTRSTGGRLATRSSRLDTELVTSLIQWPKTARPGLWRYEGLSCSRVKWRRSSGAPGGRSRRTSSTPARCHRSIPGIADSGWPQTASSSRRTSASVGNTRSVGRSLNAATCRLLLERPCRHRNRPRRAAPDRHDCCHQADSLRPRADLREDERGIVGPSFGKTGRVVSEPVCRRGEFDDQLSPGLERTLYRSFTVCSPSLLPRAAGGHEYCSRLISPQAPRGPALRGRLGSGLRSRWTAALFAGSLSDPRGAILLPRLRAPLERALISGPRPAVACASGFSRAATAPRVRRPARARGGGSLHECGGSRPAPSRPGLRDPSPRTRCPGRWGTRPRTPL